MSGAGVFWSHPAEALLAIMNRGLLISLVILAVAATAAVLFFPGGEPDSLDPVLIEDGEPQSSNDGPGEAHLDDNNTRTAAGDGTDRSSFQSDPTTIIGVVRSAADGKKLPKAKLVYSHRQFGGPSAGWSPQAVAAIGTHCDKDARFRMPPAGSQAKLQIVAWAPGYSVQRVTDLKLGDVVEIDLHPSILVQGSVVDPQGKAAAKVPVKLFDPGHGVDGYPVTAITDENGRFQIAASKQNGVSLEVRSGAGRSLMDRSINVREGMDEIRVVLSGNLSLEGSVQDDMGRPVNLATLSLKKKGERIETTATTDEEGRIQVYGLESGDWTCTVRAEGFASQEHAIAIAGGNSTTLHCTMVRNSSVRILAVDGKDRPLNGAYLRLITDPRGEHRGLKFPMESTNEDGIAIFPQVPPGRYVVGPESTPGVSAAMLFEAESGHIGGKGAATFSKLIEVLPGQETEVQILLRKHGNMTVVVTRNGEPISGARGKLLELSRNNPKEREANDLSNLDGELVFPAVWIGDYILELQGAPSEITTRRQVFCGRGESTITVELPSGRLLGQVQSNGRALSGARVMAAPKDSDWVEMTRTDSEGRFQLLGFDVGTYKLRLEADKHLPWEIHDVQHDGGHLDLGSVSMDASCQLTGRVVGLVPNPNDFIGPVIHALDGQGNGLATRPINSNGTFVFEQLPAGTVRLKVVSGARELHAQTVELPVVGDSLTIEL